MRREGKKKGKESLLRYRYIIIIIIIPYHKKLSWILNFGSATGQRMQEAWELQKFLRSAEDELVWIKEAETLLSNEDIGKDLQSVRFLLKMHQVHYCVHVCIYTYVNIHM